MFRPEDLQSTVCRAMRVAAPGMLLGVASCAVLFASACRSYPYEPDKATRAYPALLNQVEVLDIQVIPNVNGGYLTIVNASPNTYRDFDLWINRRYMRHIDEMKAGQSLELDIESFWDERGEGPFPGGWFRYYQPTPIVLAQMQLGPDQPLIGLGATHPVEDTR